MRSINDLKENYVAIMRSYDDVKQGLLAAQSAVIENALAMLEDEVAESVSLYLVNEYLGNNCYDAVYPMSEIDEIVGRVYISEAAEILQDIDLNDDYFLSDFSASGDDILDLAGCDYNDIATAIYNGDVYRETTPEMDEIVEEAHEMLEYLEEMQEEMQEERRKQKSIEKALSILQFVQDAGNAQDADRLLQAMQEYVMQEQ